MTGRAAIAVAVLLAGCLLTAGSAWGQAAGVSSANVEHVRNIPRHFDSSGARLLGNYFYITTGRDLTIYDVSTPENPQEVGDLTLPLPETPAFPEEDVDTNGDILLVENQDTLFVIDVTDKANPTVMSEVDDANTHTITCVLDCTYAYGNNGKIFDLRDPENPVLTATNWQTAAPVETSHDVTEVEPGVLLTASQPMHLLDARVTPGAPTVTRSAATEEDRFVHATRWPRGAQDKFMLVGGEEVGPGCSGGESSTFSTWDAASFSQIDDYRIIPNPAGGTTAPDSTYCTHWFQEHPNYRDGGLMAISWYEHGTRFLRIGADGQISEEGFFLPTGAPVAGQASAAYWITDRVVYVADYLRGLDVLRFNGDISGPGGGSGPPGGGTGSPGGQPTGGGASGGTPVPPARDDINRYLKLASISRCVGRRGLLPSSLRARPPERVSALAVYANGRRAGYLRGRTLKRRNLVRLPRRPAVAVRVAIRTRSGNRLSTRLSYRRCGARRAQVLPSGTLGARAAAASRYGRLCYLRGVQGAR